MCCTGEGDLVAVDRYLGLQADVTGSGCEAGHRLGRGPTHGPGQLLPVTAVVVSFTPDQQQQQQFARAQ